MILFLPPSFTSFLLSFVFYLRVIVSFFLSLAATLYSFLFYTIVISSFFFHCIVFLFVLTPVTHSPQFFIVLWFLLYTSSLVPPSYYPITSCNKGSNEILAWQQQMPDCTTFSMTNTIRVQSGQNC